MIFLLSAADVEDHAADGWVSALHSVERLVCTQAVLPGEAGRRILRYQVALSRLLETVTTEVEHTVHTVVKQLAEFLDGGNHLDFCKVQKGDNFEL